MTLKNIQLRIFGLPSGSLIKSPPANAGDTGSVPWQGRSPGVGTCNPLQYSCLGKPMDKEAWWATVCGILKELDRTEGLKQ